MNNSDIKKGLYGVVVDTTSISKVMPEINSLTYRGYTVQDLCAKSSFEEVAFLLLHGELPNKDQLNKFTEQERSLRNITEDLKKTIHLFPKKAHPMDMVRTAVSFLALEDNDLDNSSKESNLIKAMGLLSKIPTIIACSYRHRKGKNFVEPDSNLTFSENFFQMCFGKIPSKVVAKAFDVSLILYAEHSFNASTFTSRVITSSRADLYGAVTGAIASLKGPLHGGANEAVMHLLNEIGEPEKVESWMLDAFAKKKLIMGFGHRVYKQGDSRVPTMKEYFHKVAEEQGEKKLVSLAQAVEDIMIRDKNIYPNLDFPAGPAYYLMGFDIDFFTPIFVMSRITGWSAHILEQREHNSLIRPLSKYIGTEKREVTNLFDR